MLRAAQNNGGTKKSNPICLPFPNAVGADLRLFARNPYIPAFRRKNATDAAHSEKTDILQILQNS